MVGKSLLKDIPQVDLQGKVVLVRVDFNVPLAETTSGIRVGDDSRIKASLPTIVYLTESSAKVILCSHLGRPRGKCLPGLSLQPVAEVLKTYGVAVQFVNECIGQPVQDAVCSLKDGHVLLLENLRFHIEETNNDDAFSKELAAGVDIYVDDAFGTAHRAHASTVGVAQFVPRKVAGLLMDKEMTFLGQALISPKRPLAAVVGGAKVSSKLSILRSLLGRVDKLLVGGAMVYTFYLAKGYAVGDSLVEEALVKEALDVLEAAKQHGVELILAPDSHVVSTELLHPAGGGKKCTEGFTAARHHKTDATYLPTADTETCRRLQPDRGAHSATKGGLSDAEAVAVTSTAEGPMYFPLIAQPEPLTTRNDAIPPGHTGVDIGKETIQTFCSALEGCETVLWNGPMGVCEKSEFAHGTNAIMEFLSELTVQRGVVTVVCGGETVASVERRQHTLHLQDGQVAEGLGEEGDGATQHSTSDTAARYEPPAQLQLQFSHVSMGGGAALEFLEGKELPGIAALDNAV